MMTEEAELHARKWLRIRRVKRWLRPLPRRSNIHRYPILKLFSQAARKRTYLWSFRIENAVPAIYAGSILTLMPLFGIQIPSAFLLALLLRANLPILVGLQIVSNPLTILPMWFAAYQIGRDFLSVVGVQVDALKREEVRHMLDHFIHGEWSDKFDHISIVFGVTNLGAIIMGTFFGFIAAIAYRIIARRTASSYVLLQQKIYELKMKKQPPSKNEDTTHD